MRKWILLLCTLFLVGCGINSVTKEEIQAVKESNILIWRYRKNGKSWMYADKIVKRDGDNITYVTSKKEATSKLVDSILEMDSREQSTTVSELEKYSTEQGEQKKVIIEIRS